MLQPTLQSNGQTGQLSSDQSMTMQKYQIVDDLGEDEFLRLKQNIGSEGLLQPIEVYFGAEGNRWIIDGHQRVRALKELDEKEVPCIEVEPDASDPEDIDEELREIAARRQTTRRQLDDGQKKELAKNHIDWLIDHDKYRGDSTLADKLGMSDSTIRNARHVLFDEGKIPKDSKFTPQEEKRRITREYIRKHPDENATEIAKHVPHSRPTVSEQKKIIEAIDPILEEDIEGWEPVEEGTNTVVFSHEDDDSINQTIRYEVDDEEYVIPRGEGNDPLTAENTDEALSLFKDRLGEREPESEDEDSDSGEDEDEDEADTPSQDTPVEFEATTTVGDNGR